MTLALGAKSLVALFGVCCVFIGAADAGVARSRSLMPFVPATSATFVDGGKNATTDKLTSDPDEIDGIIVNQRTCNQLFWSCLNETCEHFVCPPSWQTVSTAFSSTLKVCVASKEYVHVCYQRYVAPYFSDKDTT